MAKIKQGSGGPVQFRHRHIISGRTTGVIRLGVVVGHKLIIESIVRQSVK